MIAKGGEGAICPSGDGAPTNFWFKSDYYNKKKKCIKSKIILKYIDQRMSSSSLNVSDLMKRFPAVELSYETHHKKDSLAYDVAVAIPYGKKSFLWCTFLEDRDAWILLELGRDKRVVHASLWQHGVNCSPSHIDSLVPWSFGTVLYGVVVNDTEFVVEDMLQCRGISIHKQTFGEKLAFFKEFMSSASSQHSRIYLPYMEDCNPNQGVVARNNLPYVVHHIQYRSLKQILPYVNVFPEESLAANQEVKVYVKEKAPRCDFKKPQYRKPTVFEVRADAQFDIYRLYVANGQYYGLAYIPNYKTSVMMNGIFRIIRENRNLDALEESDDEEDFQDCRSNKYVDLEKRVNMECVFHPKFKRWVPTSSPRNTILPIIHMSKL